MTLNIIDLVNQNNTLKNEVDSLKKEIARLEDILKSGEEIPDFKTWSETTQPSVAKYVEAMSCAFAKLSDINPLHCYLVTAVPDGGKTLIYWIENKDNLKNENIIHTEKIRAY